MTPQRWILPHRGRTHRVEISDAGLRHLLVWSVDDAEVARLRTSDERVVLDGDGQGAVGVRLPPFTGPARRVTLHEPGEDLGALAAAHAGVGGVDLDPEPGSAAALREEWIRAHPRLHALRWGGVAALGVLVPLGLLWLWRRPDVSWPAWSLPVPSTPWPDWSLPDLPDLPDLPSTPWPDWSLPDLPGVPAWLRETARFVGPVLVAVAIAAGEVRRRRRQDEAKATRRAGAQRRGTDESRPGGGDESRPGCGGEPSP